MPPKMPVESEPRSYAPPKMPVESKPKSKTPPKNEKQPMPSVWPRLGIYRRPTNYGPNDTEP